MVYERLHQDIVHLRWDDCEATLATDAGKSMAKEAFKTDLPLHMACERRAPDKVILDLVQANPDATMVAGKKGNLPLHIATQQCLSSEAIVAIIKAFPEALDELNGNKCTPRDFHQRSSKVKEILMRPTACWVESVEREEYYSRKKDRIVELKKKVTPLQEALDQAKRTRHDLQQKVVEIEPLVSEQEVAIALAEDQKQQLKHIEELVRSQLVELQKRMSSLETEALKEPSNDEIMMRSKAKREHITSVTQDYENILAKTESLRQELMRLKVRVRLNKSKQLVQRK